MKNTFILPRIDKLTDKLKHFIKKKYKKNTIFRAHFKLNNTIKLGKNRLSKLNNKNIVYKIQCQSCPKNYVGQSKRLLQTRCNEHENNKNLNPKYHNAITKHLLDNENHKFNFDNVQILHKENKLSKRLFAEMCFIKKQGNNSLNKMTDIEKLSDSYSILMNKF